jgi:uracil-DNA glycosylase
MALGVPRSSTSQQEVPRLAEFQSLADGLVNIDRPAYLDCARDPRMPVLGLGPRDARICIMGRDPGRAEACAGRPFVGAAGQRIRPVLRAYLCGDAAIEATQERSEDAHVFWFGTVPYKPLGNKAWPEKTRRSFYPLLRDLLLDQWDGVDVITLGTQAFEWFSINQPDSEMQRMRQFWSRDDRYQESIKIALSGTHRRREFHLHPLPHPSPANALWYTKFTDLMQTRLRSILGGAR